MNGYRALAEFNGAVLAGTETLLGAQFVTWPGATMIYAAALTNLVLRPRAQARRRPC